MTSPARLPTNNRKCEGSHSSSDESVQVWPPPWRTTVGTFFGLLSGAAGYSPPSTFDTTGVVVVLPEVRVEGS